MPHPYSCTFGLSGDPAAADITASVVDDSGTAITPQPVGTIVRHGPGLYRYRTAAMPDGQSGAVLFSTGGAVVEQANIEPRETEYADAPVSGVVSGVFARTVGGGTFQKAVEIVAAVSAGKLVENADHTSTTVYAFMDNATTALTSSNTTTSRTVTVV